MEPEEQKAGARVTEDALRVNLAWTAIWVAVKLHSEDTSGIVVMGVGCALIMLAQIVSLAVLAWRASRG